MDPREFQALIEKVQQRAIDGEEYSDEFEGRYQDELARLKKLKVKKPPTPKSSKGQKKLEIVKPTYVTRIDNIEEVKTDIAARKTSLGKRHEAAKADDAATSLGEIAGKVKASKDKFEHLRQEGLRKRETGASHGIVNAFAGTGKTFTMIMGVASAILHNIWPQIIKHLGFKVVPSAQQLAIWDFIAKEQFKSVVYVAFNNSIVKEFEFKWVWLVRLLDLYGVRLTFSTIHSMGYNIVCRQWPQLRGWNKVDSKNTQRLLSKIWNKDIQEVYREKFDVIEAVMALVKYSKITLAHEMVRGKKIESVNTPWDAPEPEREIFVSDEKLMELAEHYEVDTRTPEVFTLVNQVLNMAKTPDIKIDYEDMIWLPVINNLPVPIVDLLMVDEGQDLNRCQQEMITRCASRLLLSGDNNQAIYGFAGADVDSIPRMTEFLGGTGRGVVEMPLTITRRCGRRIVAEVTHIVPNFEAHPENHEGEVIKMGAMDMVEKLVDQDFVLCRINAPLIALAFAMLKEGKKVNIQGRDLGANLKMLIKRSKCKEVGEFLEWCEKYESTEQERIAKSRRSNKELMLQALGDKMACLRIFAQGCYTIKDMTNRIDELFKHKDLEPGQRPEGVLLSSGHRAKGLEADRVFILHPELLPHPMAKSAWAKRQEKNLEYVMKTRAIRTLVYVQGAIKGEEV
jgi:superfamily I DNA/RNA helicase